MPRYLALLRGINVGGRNKVAMADLRDLAAGLGHSDVATYIQSGNLLFTSGGLLKVTDFGIARSISDSVSNWRMMRPRSAPRAVRMPNS